MARRAASPEELLLQQVSGFSQLSSKPMLGCFWSGRVAALPVPPELLSIASSLLAILAQPAELGAKD